MIKIQIHRDQQQLTKQIEIKMSQKSMTTEDIKRGLQNIKKAQLQVLKQLKADSYVSTSQVNNTKETNKYTYQYQPKNNQNQQSNTKKIQRQQSLTNLQKNTQKKQYQSRQQYNKRNDQSLKSSINTTTSNENIEKLKKQFSSQRQQLNQKFVQITNKLNTLEKQSQKSKSQQKYAQKTIDQFNEKVNKLQGQNARLRSTLLSKDEQIQGFQKVQKKLRSQIQIKMKQNTILETQIKSLRGENVKLSRTIKQLQAQLKEQSVWIKQKKQEKQALGKNDIQSRLNLDLVMRQVKTISNNHDFLFNKLKDSAATLQMSWVEKQSQIQTSFSRMLEYFQTISSTNDFGTNETYDMIGMGNAFNINKNQQSRQTIRRQFTGTQSRVEEQEELEYFVREMNKSNNARKELQDLTLQNQSLRKRVKQLTLDLATYEASQSTNNNNKKYLSQSNRLISLELQEMREQVIKLKRYKAQLKDQHQQQQKEIVKYRMKIRDLQTRLEIESRKLVENTNTKFGLQKKCQRQDIQITSLNSIIKELNSKLSPSKQSPQTVTLNNLRQQFTKLLQTNSLIQRQNDSLKAINQGLQSQISNLKYEKSQFQTTNKQKHEIIDRQIKQKGRLVEELQKKDQKLADLLTEVDKVKSTFIKNQQQFVKNKQNYENLLEQKSQQILQLRKQIEDLYKQAIESHQLMFKYQKLQSQYKQLSRKSLKMGETLTHLWSVKQAEYFNIHQILGSLKNKDKQSNEEMQQVSGHF